MMARLLRFSNEWLRRKIASDPDVETDAGSLLEMTYSLSKPYVVQRHDQEDGSITYEVWDLRQESYRRICSINDHYDSLSYAEDNKRPPFDARRDATLIAEALNFWLAWGIGMGLGSKR